ncbi:MAG: amidohydrolase family protein [Sediminibacterium sp.]|nr:amidohydrolase family protein [Sediminibacterium sp.]
MRLLIIFFCLLLQLVGNNVLLAQNTYDIVLSNGRVIDPASGLDAIRNVGIQQNRIAAISTKPLQGKRVIDVSGLVVAPGFIDLHVHGRTNVEQEYQLHDGITTALELEWGVENIGQWYASRKNTALINYGGSVSWPYERCKSIDKYASVIADLSAASAKGELGSVEKLMTAVLPSTSEQITAVEMDKTIQNIRKALDAGGIGIGAPIGYLPKTNARELYRVFQLAGEMKALVYTHVRGGGIISVQEVINNAMLTDAPLHIVHINSSTLGDIGLAIEMVNRAKQKGYDITTELYPYTAGSTALQSAVFNEGWQERNGGISYGDLQWVATGERLTQETFTSYRKTGGIVILHSMQPQWIATGVAAPGVMIASDGMPYAKLAHPRTAGTFSRVLGKYVREDKVLDLPSAIGKMTILPARRLEMVAPAMKKKGRIQVGADADVTVFNPQTIIDKATFEKGLDFSIGVEYVLVNGVLVLANGKTVPQVLPGQPIFGKFKK